MMQRLARFNDIVMRAFARGASIADGPAKGLRFNAGRETHRFSGGDYERPVQDALVTLVKAGDVCYDVGANLGFFSLLLARLGGAGGSVYAFEPVPRNAATIERNARLNRLNNIKVMRIALGRVDGTEELLVAHHVGGAVLRSAGTPPDLAGSLMVETARADTLVDRRQIRPPDIVKIDVEGAEMDVLRGMERTLRTEAPTMVVELDDERGAACEKKVTDCRSFLHGLGYRTRLLPDSYPDTRWFVRHVVAQRAKTRDREREE